MEVLRDPVCRLFSLMNSQQGRYLIGLAGVPGAGKTTLANEWAFEVPDLTVLRLDGFHLSKAQLRQMPDPDKAFRRRGAPWTFDPAGFAERLAAVRNGFSREAVRWPDFDHGVGDPVEGGITVGPHAKVVLVEGIYAGYRGGRWEEAAGLLDETWYLDVSWEEAAPRLIQRHMDAWGMSLDDARHRAHANDRLNSEVVAQIRESADFLVYPNLP